ncbi:MAG TPA: single-stranded DNA-binding protein [Acidimicrobiales bacterium]|nr:single-stranded DNA-binding protein [Acidimicrobiales bacterium]
MATNTVTIIGNLTRDPELRFTPAGQANVTLGVAVNRSWQNRQTQEWQEATSYFDVVCWREMAENAAQTLQRGTRVIVTGRLEQRSWDTPEGDKRSKVEIIADEIGPSLRWASAQVTKTERRGADEGGGYGGGNAGGQGGGYTRGGQGGQAGGYSSNGGGQGRQPEPAQAGGYEYGDEEPF